MRNPIPQPHRRRRPHLVILVNVRLPLGEMHLLNRPLKNSQVQRSGEFLLTLEVSDIACAGCCDRSTLARQQRASYG
jgi:hypothetical protein